MRGYNNARSATRDKRLAEKIVVRFYSADTLSPQSLLILCRLNERLFFKRSVARDNKAYGEIVFLISTRGRVISEQLLRKCRLRERLFLERSVTSNK